MVLAPCTRVPRSCSEGVLAPPMLFGIFVLWPSVHTYTVLSEPSVVVPGTLECTWKTLPLFKTCSHLRANLTSELCFQLFTRPEFCLLPSLDTRTVLQFLSCLFHARIGLFSLVSNPSQHNSHSSWHHASTPASYCHWRDGNYGSLHQRRFWALLLQE